MDSKIKVQSAPHIKSSDTTRSLMLDVIIALLPTTIWGVMRFGINAALVVIVSLVACVLSETIFNLIVKRENTIWDLSCVVTGLILALNMPSEVPLYVPIIGSVFAIVVVKMLFGGLGQNFMNPALAGRCFCIISFAGLMNNYTSKMSVDVYTSATPLALIKEGRSVDLVDMFFGFIPGTIGEISTLCLLIGVIYLLVKKVIDLHIPLTYIVTFLIFILVFSERRADMNFVLGELLGGGLIFGAFFMANDYVTTPCTPIGRTVYAIFLGILTGIFRLYGKSTECISFVILIGNIVGPYLEDITIPRAYGRKK